MPYKKSVALRETRPSFLYLVLDTMAIKFTDSTHTDCEVKEFSLV